MKAKRKDPKERAEMINGELHFTVKNFALVVNKSEQTVRQYMSVGNRVRKLRINRVAGKPMIPFSELTDFPFTVSGRHSNSEVYHFDEEGKIVEQAPISLVGVEV
jgi:hypothetical protein